MPNLGPMELLIILAIVVVIFGAGKLPEIGKGLGRSIRGFKEEVTDSANKADEAVGKATTKTEARPVTKDEVVR